MSIDIQRLGKLGFKFESSPGSAELPPDVYLPTTENSLTGKHEPIENIQGQSSRNMDADSKEGRKWGEGSVGIYADIFNAGYLLKWALGNENLATGAPDVHTFYPTISGTVTKAATLVYDRKNDVEQYVLASCETLDLAVSDGMATLIASVMSKEPTESAAIAATTTSGTAFAWPDCELRFGATLSAASNASATPFSEFNLSIANNLEVIHQSGSNDVRTIRNKGLRITGSYVQFFENETDKDAYLALNKRAMEFKCSGNVNEDLTIKIPRFRLADAPIEAALDDLWVVTSSFVVEDNINNIDAGVRLISAVLRNEKASVY